MKKQLLKLSSLVAILFIALAPVSTNAQEMIPGQWTQPGWYTIGAEGTDLLMTIDGASSTIIWAAPKTGAEANLQEFLIVDHRTPSSAGLMEITAEVTPGPGIITLTTSATDPTVENPDAGNAEKRALPLAIKLGTPKEVEVGAGDYSGLDQFQRRKTKINAEGNADSNGENPVGNNALFLRTPWDNGSRFGVAPVEGAQVQFDGGAIDVIRFNFVREAPLSTKSFDTSSLSISNPVNDQLVVNGINDNISEISVYSVLGAKVLSKNIAGQTSANIGVSNLVSGMYIVKLEGTNGSFTKKIIKQ